MNASDLLGGDKGGCCDEELGEVLDTVLLLLLQLVFLLQQLRKRLLLRHRRLGYR